MKAGQPAHRQTERVERWAKRLPMSPHVSADAELYALGALEPDEQAQVAAHLAECSACANAVALAERRVAALDDAVIPQLEPPARLGARIAASARAAAPRRVVRPQRWFDARGLAVAASLTVAAGVTAGALVQHSADSEAAARNGAVLATLANSHFLHVSLTPHDRSAPVSKAIYARDGAWIYVVIDNANCRCHVVARAGSVQRDLGAPQAVGGSSALFTRAVAHPTSVELVADSGRTLADATLAYPKE